MEIFVSGSLAYDRILDFDGKFKDHILPDKIHVLNVSFMVNGLVEKFGGCAGNIIYSLALLNEQPKVLAAVGKDFDRYAERLKDLKLDLSGLKILPEEFTAGCYITTDRDNNQITGFNPGAMKYPSGYDFNSTDPEQCLAIVSPGNLDDMVGYCREYKKRSIPVIVDPGQQIPVLKEDELREMITGATMLISNDYELEMIQNRTGWKAEQILEKTGVILTTLGEEGSRILTGAGETKIGVATPDRVNDPTGVGDAYRSGLIKGMITGKSLKESAQMGATAASFAIEHLGTQEHKFTEDEFWERHNRNFGG